MSERTLNKIQEALKDEGSEAILILEPYNLRYVTGFTGTAGAALISQNKAYFITDSRYTEQAKSQVPDFEIVEHKKGIYKKVIEIIEVEGWSELGLEFNFVNVNDYFSLEEMSKTVLFDSSGLVEELREVKTSKELEIMKKAIRITEEAYTHILETIEIGMTEIEIANTLEFYMKSQGASSIAFDTIVASGYRSALPHGVASEKKIENDEFVTIDFGCIYKGYASDLTRTFAIGNPEPELLEIYEIVKEANYLVEKAARPGITGQELDAVARDYITQAGYGEQFGHTTGHGLGLEVHEGPTVSWRNKEAFVPGNVITNEPGIYLPGLGGVRIENDLLITEDGCENLMTLDTELIRL